MPEKHVKIAAQVVIAGPATEGVTSKNVRDKLPDAATAEAAARGFAELGFRTGPVVGNSFSIEADAGVFKKAFDLSLVVSEDGRVHAEGAGHGVAPAPPLSSLPVSSLPPHLRTLVSDVVFSEPPAFGPGAP